MAAKDVKTFLKQDQHFFPLLTFRDGSFHEALSTALTLQGFSMLSSSPFQNRNRGHPS